MSFAKFLLNFHHLLTIYEKQIKVQNQNISIFRNKLKHSKVIELISIFPTLLILNFPQIYNEFLNFFNSDLKSIEF